MITSLLIGAGCFWKTEAAYRFLHGVLNTEVGYLALQPDHQTLDGAWVRPDEPVQTAVKEASPFWKVEVLALRVDLDVLPLERLMEVFWCIHSAQEAWSAQDVDMLTCRSVLVVPDPQVREKVAHLIEQRAQVVPIKTRLYASAAYQSAPDSDQDFFVHHPEDSYCMSQVWPSLRTLWKVMPDQLDLDVDDADDDPVDL